ncbi:hypothetical protein [Kribbella sp. NBC_00889]|uniref:hypothetical protein n=1 Tax=Kribbella sp. NBC_00889 TaxID=2975974 RepID=UPI00386623A5|nr:hypothetical protein OG817_24555 [Kribbella sp. NBC_00889]
MTSWVYEVQVVGRLSPSVLAELDAEVGEVFTTTEPVTTLIRASTPDQSALVGLLDLLHALGLNVFALRRVMDIDERSDAEILPFSPGPRPGLST